jgi:hypothetical protein
MATDPVEILRQRNAEVDQIRGFVDLTEEAKQRRIAEVNERAHQAEYREAIETQERERAERLQKSKRSVFQIPIPLGATDGEAAQIRASYRSARSDIEYAIAPSLGTDPQYTQKELERFLEQAELTGDPELARAAYHVSIKHGVQSVVDTYLSSRPQESRAWEHYSTAHEEANAARSPEGLLERSLTEQAFRSA